MDSAKKEMRKRTETASTAKMSDGAARVADDTLTKQRAVMAKHDIKHHAVVLTGGTSTQKLGPVEMVTDGSSMSKKHRMLAAGTFVAVVLNAFDELGDAYEEMNQKVEELEATLIKKEQQSRSQRQKMMMISRLISLSLILMVRKDAYVLHK